MSGQISWLPDGWAVRVDDRWVCVPQNTDKDLSKVNWRDRTYGVCRWAHRFSDKVEAVRVALLCGGEVVEVTW